MNEKPKISIIIPIHNGEKYLSHCLESILNQTERNIEIICIDDCSSDETLHILNIYKKQDDRIKIIQYNLNKTASIARKDGALQANGDYIWFIDADDMIERDACEKLLLIEKANSVDILQFNTTIINEANLDTSRINGYKKFLTPYSGGLKGKSVFEGCFENNLYQFTIWNKLFSSDLCKKAFQYVEDVPLPIAQDKYAFFILAYFAKSYHGVPDLYLYHYRLGAGNTAKQILSKEQFSRHCKMVWVANAINRFLLSQGIKEKYNELYSKTRKQLLKSCVGEWHNRILTKDKAWAYDEMLQYWEPAEVIAEVAKLNWTNKFDIASILETSDYFQKKPKKIKTIGIYYHHLSIGGAQRVVAQLIWLWQSLGYKCILLTDSPPGKFDYEIPCEVSRIMIPSYFSLTSENYSERAEAWVQAIKDYDIDLVVYHAWMANCLLWDTMVIKSLYADVLVHCHGVFSMLLTPVTIYWGEMPAILRLMDGIVTLGKADQYFWKQFNPRTFLVVNPISFEINEEESASLNNKNIIWVGRISDEKRPFDAIDIIAKVIQEVPDAKLYIIGNSENKTNYIQDLSKYAKKLNVEKAIVFCGFQKEVKNFYLNSSVFLMTSNYEGFSLTLFEAKLVGLPCVMYELPYLMLAEKNQGIIPIKMGDVYSAADAIIRLLTNLEYSKKLGADAKRHAEQLRSFDYKKVWKEIFDSFTYPVMEQKDYDNTRITWDTLLEHYRTGARKQGKELFLLKKSLTDSQRTFNEQKNMVYINGSECQQENVLLKDEIEGIYHSYSFRIGRFITYIPRKIRGGIRCYKEHGMRYTLRRVKEKFLGLLRRKHK